MIANPLHNTTFAVKKVIHLNNKKQIKLRKLVKVKSQTKVNKIILNNKYSISDNKDLEDNHKDTLKYYSVWSIKNEISIAFKVFYIGLNYLKNKEFKICKINTAKEIKYQKQIIQYKD